MRITHYTIRDVRELNGVQGAAPEWDVVAKYDDGNCFYSPGTFESVDDANQFITKQFNEREIFDDYWGDQQLYPYEVARIPHDAWIMVPALEEEPDDTPAHIPHPPVSGYDEAPEEGTGERAGREAYLKVLGQANELKRLAVYHADTAIKMVDDGIYGNYEITLWRLRGVPRTFYPTKMAAEVAARAHFPHDNPTVRYSRVSFITVPIDSDNFESD